MAEAPLPSEPAWAPHLRVIAGIAGLLHVYSDDVARLATAPALKDLAIRLEHEAMAVRDLLEAGPSLYQVWIRYPGVATPYPLLAVGGGEHYVIGPIGAPPTPLTLIGVAAAMQAAAALVENMFGDELPAFKIEAAKET